MLKKIFEKINSSSLYFRLYIAVTIIIILGVTTRNSIEYYSIEHDAFKESLDYSLIIKNYMDAINETYNDLIVNNGIEITKNTYMLFPAHSTSIIHKKFISSNNDINIRNVSDSVRNEKNFAHDFELAALNHFRESNDSYIHENIQLEGKEYYFFAQPIKIEPICLMCHGAKANAPSFIQENYNSGFDYQLGDIRGITSILISKEILTHESTEKYLGRVFASILIAFVIILIMYLAVKILTKKELELIAQLNKLSYKDELTKINNRRSINEHLSELHEIFLRYKTKYSIIMIDIDHFKEVNDTFGHDVGDNVLIEIAKILNKARRTTDHIGRWGGEEFMMLVPHNNASEAIQIAQRIRHDIEKHSFKIVLNLTVSLGVTEVNDDDSLQSITKRVDEALYEAKESGRNRVVVK